MWLLWGGYSRSTIGPIEILSRRLIKSPLRSERLFLFISFYISHQSFLDYNELDKFPITCRGTRVLGGGTIIILVTKRDRRDDNGLVNLLPGIN